MLGFRLLCVCTHHASCARVRQRAATMARRHQTDDRRLTPCRKRAGAFRPRVSPWVRAPRCTRGESGRLAPRRPKLGQERAEASFPPSGAFYIFFLIFGGFDLPRRTQYIYVCFSKETSSNWFCVVMTHNRATCRFPTLKTKVQKLFPCRVNDPIGFSKRPIHFVGTTYTCHIFSGEQKVLQTHTRHKTTIVMALPTWYVTAAVPALVDYVHIFRTT